MDNTMRTMIERSAHLLLEEYRNKHSTWNNDRTPIEDIAIWLGLTITTFHPSDYPTGTYGFMDPDDSENLIWICRDLPENLHRFTVAHEIGHAVLHCNNSRRLSQFAPEHMHHIYPGIATEDPCNQTDIQDDLADYLEQDQMLEILGVGHTYNPRSERELAANLFAAELLLPHDRLRALYQEPTVPARTLTSIFGISPAALLNRLIGMLAPDPEEPEETTEIVNTVSTIGKRYDEYQQAAIEAPTPALIVAGPGSGKTSTLIGRVEYLINRLHIPSQQILALTFSRKATTEMEERLQAILSTTQHPLPKASTFHAFCADLLRQHGSLIGLREDFTLINDAEGYFILREQANNLHLTHLQKLHTPTYFFPDILSAISRARDELVSGDEYAKLAQAMYDQAQDDPEAREIAEKAQETAIIYARYEAELQRRGDTDFGGLLMLAIQLLEQHPEVLKQQQQLYQHILVDEFQDVNRASAVLLRVLAGNERRVWVVGDANQAIYGFRGASPANISQFEHDFPSAVILPLSRNYRSLPDLVTIAEAFRCQELEAGTAPGKNIPVRSPSDDPIVTLAEAANEENELAGIIQDIHRKLAHGYTYKDIVILCRKRAQVSKVTQMLAQVGMPVIEQSSMLEQEHIKDVLSLLLLCSNSSGMGLLRAAHLPDHPLSQKDIEDLLLAARDPEKNLQALLQQGETPLTMSPEGHHSLLHIQQTIQSLQHATNIWTMIAEYLFLESTLIRSQIALPREERDTVRLADYLRLLELARHYDQQQQARLSTITTDQARSIEMPTLSGQIRGFLEHLSLLAFLRQDSNSRHDGNKTTEEAQDLIRVMTVHASKGLEFPVVYMPYLVQRRFPNQFRPKQLPLPTGLISLKGDERTRHANEEACLFYVGTTRARNEIILSYSQRYGQQIQKRSLYLDTLEKGLPEERFMKINWSFPSDKHFNLSASSNTRQSTGIQPGETFINAMLAPRISARAIEDYQRCPRQFAYSYIYHFSGDPDSFQLFWQATQKTVEELNKKLQSHQIAGFIHPSQTEVQELYSQHWQNLGGPSAPFPTLYEEHGHQVMETLRRKRHTLASDQVDWQLRSKYTVDLHGKTIHVTIDRVETDQDQDTPVPARFVRTRFGNSKTKPEANTRDLFYTLAYRQKYPDNKVEIHNHNMSTDEYTPITLSVRKEQSLTEAAAKAIEGLEKHDYPARPDQPQNCPQCPFFFICPA